MKDKIEIPPNHPRASSLKIREELINYYHKGIVAEAGLSAHGRGEAFDYLLGEITTPNALKAIESAAAALLTAELPVISVNGNVAALVAKDIVRLAGLTGAKIEVNIFYGPPQRKEVIKKVLEEAGAEQVLGIGESASATITEIGSERRRVDPEGIFIGDLILVPLEDGDRTEALVGMGKKVIAIDLNPLSRTAQIATITIVDNIVRALPTLVEVTRTLREIDRAKLNTIQTLFNNKENLAQAINHINQRLSELARRGTCVSIS